MECALNTNHNIKKIYKNVPVKYRVLQKYGKFFKGTIYSVFSFNL